MNRAKEVSIIAHMIGAVVTLGIIAGFIGLGERLNWDSRYLLICGGVVVLTVVWKIAYRAPAGPMRPAQVTPYYTVVAEERDDNDNPVYVVEAASMRDASRLVDGHTYTGPYEWHIKPGQYKGRYVISLERHAPEDPS